MGDLITPSELRAPASGSGDAGAGDIAGRAGAAAVAPKEESREQEFAPDIFLPADPAPTPTRPQFVRTATAKRPAQAHLGPRRTKDSRMDSYMVREMANKMKMEEQVAPSFGPTPAPPPPPPKYRCLCQMCLIAMRRQNKVRHPSCLRHTPPPYTPPAPTHLHRKLSRFTAWPSAFRLARFTCRTP